MSSRPRVLVIDDSPAALVLVRRALEPHFDVSTRHVALGSIAVIAREAPDLVVLDAQMPLVAGADIAASMYEHLGSKRPLIILHSDLPLQELRAEADRCGADGFAPKEPDGAALLEEVRRALKHRVSAGLRDVREPTDTPQPRDDDAEARLVVVAGSRTLWPSDISVLERGRILVKTVYTGREALAVLATPEAGLSVCGQDLPDMSLEELCRQIRAHERTSSLPILLIAQPPQLEQARAVEQAGATLTLVRPFETSELDAAVGKLIGVAVRREIRLLVRLSVAGEALAHLGYTRDLSASGMLLQSERDLPTNDLLKVRFILPGTDREITAGARVVRKHQSPGCHVVGLAFESVSDEDRARIRSFVSQKSSGGK